MEKIMKNVQEAGKIIQAVDHMIYVTFPLIKDKKLLLKILVEMKKAIACCINAILQYEYLYKRIKLFADPKTNFRTFEKRCAPRYKITDEEIKNIKELFELVESHNQSSMEIIKDEKIIILSGNLEQKTVTLEKTKEFLAISKKLMQNMKSQMHSNF